MTGAVLLDILIILLAAKMAAEIAERVGLPAVVGEILAGIVVGPSVLGLVIPNEVLRVLGELGVILLLLEVGLQLDLGELLAVGRTSLSVAVVGVAVPFVLGVVAATALGHGGSTAVFVGASLTATSVGISARVFADLRALATTEARTVLGAAVADDVMGLVILTVVVRLTTGGSVTVASVASIVALAVAFLGVGGMAGVRLAPAAFGWIHRVSRSPGTLLGLVLAFTLGFAELAGAAKLAPIVGAFVAGLSLSRTVQSDRIRRDVAPIGHLFVPVFFLQIGIDAQIRAFARPEVLGLAAALLVAAVIGKLVSAAGAFGAPGDKILIGVGMLPRGEVGLIFATIGLREGVLSQDLYAALLLVVLATTLVAPPWLRRRLRKVRAGAEAPARPAAPAPRGGWLAVDETTVELAAPPPDGLAVHVALRAALAAARRRPGPRLSEWLESLPDSPVRWDTALTDDLVALLAEGNARSWRLVDATEILDKALPEVGETLRRHRDPFDLDLGASRWTVVERVRELLGEAFGAPDDPIDRRTVLLAAFAIDLAADGDPLGPARRLVSRLDLGDGEVGDISFLVAEAAALRVALSHAAVLDEERVVQLAVHVQRPGRARALCVLALALGELDPVANARLAELYDLVQLVLARPHGATGTEGRTLAEQRREAAVLLAGSDPHVVERLVHTPRAYLLVQEPAVLARQARLLEPLPSRGRVRVAVQPLDAGRWKVDVACRDRPGLLAAVTGVLRSVGEVTGAVMATWPDGGAIESFEVRADAPPGADRLSQELESSRRRRDLAPPMPDADVRFDDSSPWYTRVVVRTLDRPGLLHDLAVALAAAGADIHLAEVATSEAGVVDSFDVTDRNGRKLDDLGRARVVQCIRGGVEVSGRRFGRHTTLIKSKQSGDGTEISPPYGAERTPEPQRREHVCDAQQSDSPVPRRS